MKELSGKISLVTGGSRGIGKAIAMALAESGSDVVVDFHHNKDKADEVVSACQGLGVRSAGYQCDIADADAVEKLVAQVNQDFGPIHIVVNNAGINRDRSFAKMTRAMWDEVINVDLGGPFNVIHSTLPAMLEAKWGRIINITSLVGQTGNFGQANYSAAKGGLHSFTMTLAREVARKGITANCVSPGFTETDMTAGMPEKVIEQVNAMIPMGRMGTPEEVAHAVVFLASARAGYITGEEIAVNGGMFMG